MSKQRLVSVTFRDHAGPLAGYVSVGKGTGAVEAIALAVLQSDGTWRPVDKERAEGIGVTRREGLSSRQHYVPMGNVACVSYEPVDEAKAAK